MRKTQIAKSCRWERLGGGGGGLAVPSLSRPFHTNRYPPTPYPSPHPISILPLEIHNNNKKKLCSTAVQKIPISLNAGFDRRVLSGCPQRKKTRCTTKPNSGVHKKKKRCAAVHSARPNPTRPDPAHLNACAWFDEMLGCCRSWLAEKEKNYLGPLMPRRLLLLLLLRQPPPPPPRRKKMGRAWRPELRWLIVARPLPGGWRLDAGCCRLYGMSLGLSSGGGGVGRGQGGGAAAV